MKTTRSYEFIATGKRPGAYRVLLNGVELGEVRRFGSPNPSIVHWAGYFGTSRRPLPDIWNSRGHAADELARESKRLS